MIFKVDWHMSHSHSCMERGSRIVFFDVLPGLCTENMMNSKHLTETLEIEELRCSTNTRFYLPTVLLHFLLYICKNKL